MVKVSEGPGDYPHSLLPGCEMSKNPGVVGLRQSFLTNTFKVSYSIVEHYIKA